MSSDIEDEIFDLIENIDTAFREETIIAMHKLREEFRISKQSAIDACNRAEKIIAEYNSERKNFINKKKVQAQQLKVQLD
jgi:predicted DNA-binding protein YlxM (UPF0122 family)